MSDNEEEFDDIEEESTATEYNSDDESEDEIDEINETVDDDTESVTRSIIIKKNKEIRAARDAKNKSSNIVNNIIVPQDERSTSNVMSIFEFSNIIATRATEISKNGLLFTKAISHDPIVLAKDELKEGRCPYIIKRVVGRFKNQDIIEEWSANELIYQ